MSDERAYVPQKILVFCRLTIPIHQYTIFIGIQFIRDKFTGCSLNTTRLPQCRNKRETTFYGWWIVCRPARKRLEDSDSLFCAPIRENSTLHVVSSSLLSPESQVFGLMPSVMERKSTSHQLPRRSVESSEPFVFRRYSFLVLIRFALSEAMSYFLTLWWKMVSALVDQQEFRIIFALCTNIREICLSVKRECAIASGLGAHSAHQAPCAHEMA